MHSAEKKKKQAKKPNTHNFDDCGNVIFWVSCGVFLNNLPIFDLFFPSISTYMGISQSFLQIWNIAPFLAKLHNIYRKYTLKNSG